jgi:pimeloyl-ACP methyl ester carboxylesterase
MTTPTHAPDTVARNGDIELGYRLDGPTDGAPLLLSGGVGATIDTWPQGFITLLTEQGFRVARYDYRGLGSSARLPRSAPRFGMADLADDAVAVLDALGWREANLLGWSAGGAVSQWMAINHPTRVRTLTSMMSFSAFGIGKWRLRTLLKLVLGKPTTEASARRAFQLASSPGFPPDEQVLDMLVRTLTAPDYDMHAAGRHNKALRASGDFRAALHNVRVPTLVLHGPEDRIRPIESGLETLKAIPGAKFVSYPGWGHDLDRELWPAIAAEIQALVDRVPSAVGLATEADQQ